jgi:cobalt/nickel transport system ATP-binding protein
MNAYIRIENLTYSYPDGSLALDGIDLSISKKERISIIGPNGAGKSTLILHLNGILRGKGSITIDGLEMDDRNIRQIRRKVGVIFQDPNDQLFCPTVHDDVAFGPLHFGLSAGEIDSIVDDSLREVTMLNAKPRPSHHLSLGEKRRVSIATVLACRPDVLIFDEPAAMLDPKRRRWLIGFMNTCDKTIITATHDLELALLCSDRTILMQRGRIVADGPTRQILSNERLLAENDLEPAFSSLTAAAPLIK